MMFISISITSRLRWASLLLALVCASAVMAKPQEDAPEEQQDVSQPTYDALSKARKLMDKQHYAEALAVLQELLPKVKDNAYEAALTQQALAYAHLARRDYPKAILAIEVALAKHVLPTDVTHSLYYNGCRSNIDLI